MFDLYQKITDQIIAHLDKGVIPWRCPWKCSTTPPQNMISKRPYRGINAFLLNLAPYKQPYWLTMRQVNHLGGHVRKDENATIIVFWKFLMKNDTDDIISDKSAKRIPYLRYYYVFNIEQTVGINPKYIPEPPTIEKLDFQPLEAAEKIMANYPNPPATQYYDGGACYHPTFDLIKMPHPELFESVHEVYSTWLHEAVHSSGHSSRLNRPGLQNINFGSQTYSYEELIAEMGASFLCAECGIFNAVAENSAAYIQGWREKLREKENKKWLIQAAGAAQKAADHILGRTNHQEESDHE